MFQHENDKVFGRIKNKPFLRVESFVPEGRKLGSTSGTSGRLLRQENHSGRSLFLTLSYRIGLRTAISILNVVSSVFSTAEHFLALSLCTGTSVSSSRAQGSWDGWGGLDEASRLTAASPASKIVSSFTSPLLFRTGKFVNYNINFVLE